MTNFFLAVNLEVIIYSIAISYKTLEARILMVMLTLNCKKKTIPLQ